MKDAYYFSHDSNARNDHKILQLRCDMGWEGYGLFFALLEIMRDEKNYMLPSQAKATLKLSLNIDEALLDKFLSSCFSIGLLVESEGFIYSESFLHRMDLMDSKRRKLSEAGKKGSQVKATLKPPLSQVETTLEQCSSKERKRKEKKGKEKKETFTHLFDLFWDKYPRKESKKVSFDWWERNVVSFDMSEKIMASLGEHVDAWADTEKRFIPHPSTWLNQERWNDAINSSREDELPQEILT